LHGGDHDSPKLREARKNRGDPSVRAGGDHIPARIRRKSAAGSFRPIQVLWSDRIKNLLRSSWQAGRDALPGCHRVVAFVCSPAVVVRSQYLWGSRVFWGGFRRV